MQLSEFGERKARQHLVQCDRCQSIYASFTRPEQVRQRHRPKSGRWLLVLLAMLITPASFVYLGDSSNLDLKDLPYYEKLSDLLPTATEPGFYFKSRAEEVVSGKAKAESASITINHSGTDTGTETGPNRETRQALKNKVRGIYGKIVANGKPLKGVTVMVPGSDIAKVSNSKGKYYIQVPTDIDSLKFIYQGKQLVKELDPTLRNHDVHLKIERLTYPQIDTPESGGEITASN